MDFRILGPLEVHGDDGPIDVRGRKPRAVLAVLLLNPNQPVSAERLAVALWGREAPAGAVRTVHVNVSRLRKALSNGEILTTTPAGYQLRVLPGELDADRFQSLVDDGRRAMGRGQVDEAGRLLREALALWRGPPLGDLAFEPFAQVEIARLEEQHEAAIASRVEADLAAGRHEELVGELRRLVAEHPTHERLAGQLMLALYRCGRQADALDAYREARRRLADELGVEPGDELRALQDAILHQDPKLLLEPAGELPHELDPANAPPLVGRETEMAWLRERWDEARAGHGRLTALAGARGMGRTRLASELAGEVHASGGSVLYASGAWPARAVGEVLDRARDARRPLLLVVDDADQASRELLTAVRDVAGGEALVLATATAHEALEGLEPGIVIFLDLDRLGPAAVAKIAALYVPDEAADILPAEWLLGASAGVPQRVHDVASQWARERVDTVAGTAAAERSRLRLMEDELAGGVAQLQAVREWHVPPGHGEQRVICPFKGLASFEADDAPYFFGRERLVAELVARLVGAPLLAVVGPSGSGKSSVVRAGLLPALKSGVLPGSQDWPQFVIRPGEHPLRSLDRTLASAPADRFVLAVDQFEETFTACRDEAEREAFISQLVRESSGTVVIALRADFYGRCAEYPALSRLLASNHVLVGPMQPEELRRAVVCPAQRVGLSVEDELVERIVEDVQDAPGALPLLSTALLELWQNRDGRRLRLAAYERTGGVHGAVARLAEDAYSYLDDEQRELARRVLLQLVEVDDDGSVERRRLPLTDLGAKAEPLLDVLADARLVTVSEGTVELAHEALLREWPRLSGWIDDGREDLRIERNLRAGAREWERVGRDDGALFRGARLAEAQEWSARSGGPAGAERDFLETSVARRQRDRRARRRGLAFAFGGLAFGLVAFAVVAAIAVEQRRDAISERDTTASRQLALESGSVLDADPELALRLAMSANDLAPTGQAATALREATVAFPQAGAVRADSTDDWAAAYSPDGERFVTGGTDGRAITWNAATREAADELDGDHGILYAAQYTGDGKTIALGFEDGTVVLTDQTLSSPRTVLKATGAVRSVAFSGDDKRLAVATEDGSVRVISLDNTEPARSHTDHKGAVNAVDFNADGTRIVSGGADGTVVLWNLADDSRLALKGADLVRDVAFSPHGKVVAAVSDDGVIRRWDATTGEVEKSIDGTGGALYAVAFSADGSRLAAGGIMGVIGVWNATGGPPLVVLRGQRSRVYDLGFGSSVDRIVSAGDDGFARLWDARAPLTVAVPGGDARFLSFNFKGDLLASSSSDGVVRLWDPATGERLDSLRGTPGFTVAEFSPASNSLVIADAGARVRVWEKPSEPARTVVQLSEGESVDAVNFDPTGERIVYVVSGEAVIVRDLASGDEQRLEGAPPVYIYDAQFSPDGQRVAIITEKNVVAVWHLDDPTHPEVLEGHIGHQNGLDFAPDGRLATAGGDGTVRVWPAGDGEPVVMRGHTTEVGGVAFWPDGSTLLSAGLDGTLRLWNPRTGDPLGRLMTVDAQLYDVAVGGDGTIATLDEKNILRIFKCEVCGSIADVEALAQSRHPRQLSPDERERFLVAEG